MLEISKDEVVDRLKFDNAWWLDPAPVSIPFSDKPKRKYFASFLAHITTRDINRALVLMGPRRVGKTVMIYQSIAALINTGVSPKQILYLSLETPIYTGLGLEKLLHYFQELFAHTRHAQLFVFFDEIQYRKDWEVHLKSLVDSYPSYRFVATGSAAAALKLKSNESGAGRFSDFNLPPLTFAEYLQFIGRESELIYEHTGGSSDTKTLKYATHDVTQLNHEFINYLNYGGYPEAVFSRIVQDDPSQYIKSDIIDKVLLRDLPSLYGISDIQELNRLFTTLAYNTGKEISLDALSKSSGVVKSTIKKYLEYLEAAFLIKRFYKIDQNAKRFERTTNFKVYLTNPSMRAALFGAVKEDSEAMGELAETAIIGQWQHSQFNALYYARWPKGEIDVVCLDPIHFRPQWLVEIKWSDRHLQAKSALDNCVAFAAKHTHLSVLRVTSKTITRVFDYGGHRFDVFPTSLYAYALGANILSAEP